MTTKVHLACDGRGRPLAILLTPGRRHDSICARPLLERIRVPHTGLGRPRHRGQSPRLPRLPAPTRHRADRPREDGQQRHRHNRGRRG
ncbi:transposase [Streptomyces chartreusis]|uniref:transposase n=1 Tax=Streptomyces chartreusis TaxID=1969 RepID=UPI0038234623